MPVPRPLVVALFALGLGGPAGAEELRTTSVPGMDDGVAARFEGGWSVMRPEGSNSLLTCQLPTEIRSEAEGQLVYRDVGGRELSFEVSAEDGRTKWTGTQPQVAVWLGRDDFLLYPLFPDGRLDTEYAMLFERCESWPRESFAGSVPGAVEPFAGSWAEALPAKRGGGEPEPVSDCTSPVTFTVEGPTSILQTIAGREPVSLAVAERNGRTILPNGNYIDTVIWVSPDRWHLHGPSLSGGIDWNSPVIFTRCE